MAIIVTINVVVSIFVWVTVWRTYSADQVIRRVLTNDKGEEVEEEISIQSVNKKGTTKASVFMPMTRKQLREQERIKSTPELALQIFEKGVEKVFKK